MRNTSYIQCSMCFTIYTFEQYMKLKTEWVNPKRKHEYGKRAICNCGAVFHKNQWAIQTKKDIYLISTVHLEIGHTSVTDYSDLSNEYWYETMIFKYRNPKEKHYERPLDYQMRYKTMKEAIKGHKKVVDKLEDIILHPQDYPMGVIALFCNAIEATREQKKTIQSDVKERMK